MVERHIQRVKKWQGLLTHAVTAGAQRQQPAPVRYGAAVALSLLALLLTVLLWPLARFSPWLLPLGALLAAVWFCGIGPGLLALLLFALLIAPGALPLPHTLAGLTGASALQTGLFVLAAAWLSLRLEAVARLTRQREEEREQAQQREQEREQLLQREQWARAEAQAVQARLTLLMDAGNLLMASLDDRVTLERLGRLAVENLADWCLIDLAAPEGSLQRVVAASADPERQPVVDRLRPFMPDPMGSHPITKALISGQPEVSPEGAAAALQAVSVSEEHAWLLDELGITTWAAIPLAAGDRVFGVMSLYRAQADRPFHLEDLAIARVLAHRAALGLDNARLYREAQQEITERRRIERILSEHQARIETLNQRLQRAMTETHHRVKNNLQIIAAMVDLQLMKGEAAIPASEIQRLATHIRTLATVHDILTQEAKEEGQVHEVSASALLGKLLPLLQQTASAHRIQHHIENACLSARQGTSLALVVNELVSNAIKHGRQNVEVRLTVAESRAQLLVSDDGPGFPSGFDPMRAANTGLALVENLSRWDLAGETAYTNGPEGGACVAVNFPLPSA